jgi:hypothetical protein
VLIIETKNISFHLMVLGWVVRLRAAEDREIAEGGEGVGRRDATRPTRRLIRGLGNITRASLATKRLPCNIHRFIRATAVAEENKSVIQRFFALGW